MSVPEGRSPRSLANFYAQAADLVRVRSLSCTRNGRSRHFRQKNTYVLAQFPSDPLPGLLWPRCLPDASQMPLRCLSDASQMPLRCLQMLPRCLQMLPQKNCLGSRAGVILVHGRRCQQRSQAVRISNYTLCLWTQYPVRKSSLPHFKMGSI